jgi:hypothetical protein
MNLQAPDSAMSVPNDGLGAVPANCFASAQADAGLNGKQR